MHWFLFLSLFFFKGERERKRRDKNSQKKNVLKKMFLIGIVDSFRERERRERESASLVVLLYNVIFHLKESDNLKTLYYNLKKHFIKISTCTGT